MLIRFSVTDRKYMIIHIYIWCTCLLWRAHLARAYTQDFYSKSFFHTFISTFIYSNHFPVMIQFAIIFEKIKFINYSDSRMIRTCVCEMNFHLFDPYTIRRRFAIIYRNYGTMHQMLKLNVFASFKAFYIIFCAK